MDGAPGLTFLLERHIPGVNASIVIKSLEGSQCDPVSTAYRPYWSPS